MPINILMPALSPTMEKGNLAKWRKKEGDKVAPGDIIAEIETDKATMDYEAVDEGTLAKIVVPEGTADVPVNQLIAVLAGAGEDVKAAASGAGADAAPAKQAAPATPSFKTRPAGAPQDEVRNDASPAPAPKAAPRPEEAAPAAVSRDAGPNGGQRVFASPLARRIAREAGIDIARILGTGPHSRVVARDVAAAKSGEVPLKAAGGVPAAPTFAAAMPDDKVRALFEDGSYEVVPHDNMRKIIAQRLMQAKQTIPHFYLTVTCTIDKLLAAREDINASAPKGEGGKPAFKLSVNDFVIKAMAQALMRVPDANVTWTEAGMLKHKHADVGVAVAIPGGLITPIIRKAELKTLTQVSAEMKDFVARARARKLKPQEYQGGSTAISNLGMYGIEEFSAVINPPHATILAVGASAQNAVVNNGEIDIATQMKITLSTDHRAVDGALGAEFLSAIKAMLENPVMLVV
jgi:pyruvate dehydrogenase E2 component (dihydrolipoamide acetyltransferase)